MTGHNHERVPGSDAPPLIEVVSGVCGYVLLVRSWKGVEVLRMPFQSQGKAVAAEAALRSDLRHAPRGDVVAVLERWKQRAADAMFGTLDDETWWT